MVEEDWQRVVVLTGAGISAESGIKTFRDSNGLWEEHSIEDVATPEGFARDPELVHRFYSARRRQLLEVQPNAAHQALAAFQRRVAEDSRQDKSCLLVTQNVDDLHERAGSPQVLHMHGCLGQVRCTASEIVHEWSQDCTPTSVCDCCGRAGRLRPHVVWFGEIPLQMDSITEQLSGCDLFVSIGTSGNVYPAAGFFQIAKAYGARTVELNLEPSANADAFDEGHYGPASRVVVEFFSALGY